MKTKIMKKIFMIVRINKIIKIKLVSLSLINIKELLKIKSYLLSIDIISL